MAEISFLDADNDFNTGITVTDENGDPVTGLTITAFISASRSQAAAVEIHADLSITLADAGNGVYTGLIQGGAITARLVNANPSYTNKRVYLMRKAGSDYFRPRICRVRDGRAA